MDKAFVLKSAIPELMTNGKISVYLTLDPKVNMILILKDFDWPERSKNECFRCERCKCYIFPDDKSKTKDGKKYHKICPPIKKASGSVEPEIESILDEEIKQQV